MDERQWLSEYFESLRAAVCDEAVRPTVLALRQQVKAAHARGSAVLIAGNGGSAAIASHCAVDFTKSAGIRCLTFNEPDLITCLANDYGYERWVEKALEFYARPGDLVILISSSGQSPNMVRAAQHARARGLTLVTLTGFSAANPLRALGHVNFWVDSTVYNVVEMTHQMWLLAVCDLLVEERTCQTVES